MKSKNSINKLGILAAAVALLGFGSSVSAYEGALDTDKSKQGCGIIDISKHPPTTRSIYPVVINSIDGQTVNLRTGRFALSEGKHVLKVIELISEESVQRRRDESKSYHIIEFTVEANKKYNLGAKYIRKNRSKFKTGEHWVPEVWRTSDKECTL